MADFAECRRNMVDSQIRPADVTRLPVIEAMLSVPRERFVPDGKRGAAYAEGLIELSEGRSIVEPRTIAKMLDELDIRPTESVLVVGAGLGYTTAVVARIAQFVVGVEDDPKRVGEAEDALAEIGADNAVLHEGALEDGAAEHGPYDVVLVEGGVERVPDSLVEQVNDGGRIACLFMNGEFGRVEIGRKIGGRVHWRFAFDAGAPVAPGFEKPREFAL